MAAVLTPLKAPDLLQQTIFPKRRAPVSGGATRTRFAKPRPNINALVTKTTKEVTPQEEEKCDMQHQDAFEKESLSVEKVNEATDSLAKNILNSRKRSIAEETSEPRKTFATACEALSASGSTMDKEMPNILEDDSLSSNIIAIEESIDNPPSHLSEEDIVQQQVTTDKESSTAEINGTTDEINGTTDDPTLKNISNSPRKRVTSKKTRERRKRLTKTTEVPPRSEMKMIDLINYIPDGAPMKYESSRVNIEVEEKTDENTSPEEKEETEASSAPRVIIGDNGEIIIDEASLVIQRKEKDVSSSIMVENENTTYSSFRRKLPKKWTRRETFKFYKALSLVGTDFALMTIIFNDTWKIARTRHELKLKFKREERIHAKLVFQAMYESQTCDTSILDNDSDEIIDSSEDEDDPPERENNAESNELENRQNEAEQSTDTQDQSIDDETDEVENSQNEVERSTDTQDQSIDDETDFQIN